jgi:hypothetical protein
MSIDILQCDSAAICKNSEDLSGPANKCAYCRLAPGQETFDRDYFRPLSPLNKHPQLLKEKNDKKFQIQKDRIAKRQNRNTSKMRISWKAEKSEKSAENRLVKATKNSGRSNRDGDLTAAGFIGLDNKLQTKNTEPVVHLDELDKARADAKRGGMLVGGLVIETKNGVSVTVFKTEDFGIILGRLT